MHHQDDDEIAERNQNAREAVEIILRELKRQQADPSFGAGVDEEFSCRDRAHGHGLKADPSFGAGVDEEWIDA